MKSAVKFLIFLFVSLSIITSCEKDDYKPEVNPLDTIPQITFTTELNEIGFIIYADKIDQPNVWIDLNGNGKKDSTETITIFEKYLDLKCFFGCTKSVKSVTIYGKITHFLMPTQQLTHIDVSKNKWLKYLDLLVNEIEELDVSKNINLENLSCSANKISRLDVSNCPKLIYLNCFYNYIENLDISKNINLEELGSGGNLLRNLDVTQNTELKKLTCSRNRLTHLDVSHCSKLEELECTKNEQLKCIKVNEKQMNDIPKNWYKPTSAIYTTTDCE